MILKYFILLTIVCHQCLCQQCEISKTEAGGSHAPTGPYCKGQLIFEDNFDNLDVGKWDHENTLSGGGNWEFQWYTNNRSISFASGGNLHIRPTKTSDFYDESFLTSGTIDLGQSCTDEKDFGCSRTGTETHVLNPIISAKLETKNSFYFKYGKMEVRAKFAGGDWLWPAIWLLPERNTYGSWPSSGEINVAESRGNRQLFSNGQHIGSKRYSTTLHYGPNPQQDHWEESNFFTNSRNGLGFNEDFHTYTVEWFPEGFKFFLDGQQIGSFIDQKIFKPFDQQFYIILSLAVGGTNHYFPDNAQNPTPKPWSNNSPLAATQFWNDRGNWLPTWNYGVNDERDFTIDYVRVYAL